MRGVVDRSGKRANQHQCREFLGSKDGQSAYNPFVRTHQGIDRRSLEMVRRIVAKIDSDPERRGLAHAKSVCERWALQGNISAREWMVILGKPWEQIRVVLLDESDEGQRLRQTDPFVGVLTPEERWEIYRQARGA